MGNAFTAIADSAEGGFWNPAGLIQWQGARIFGSTKASDRESYAFDSKCVACSYRDMAIFWGNKIMPRGAEGEVPDYTYYSIARKLNPYIALGASVKFKRRHPYDSYQFFGYNPGYDLGILYKPNSASSVGALIQNMGDRESWISVARFGMAHKLKDNLLLTIDAAFLFDGDVSLEPYIGCEWLMLQWVLLRSGVSNGNPTAGLGLRFYKFSVDYAWIRDDSGNAHFISGEINL
jgi:hypothetical protein